MPKRDGAKVIKSDREKKVDEELRRQEERKRQQAIQGNRGRVNPALVLGARLFQGIGRR